MDQKTQNLILGKAADRFFRTGFKRFVMDDLARDAGISKKTLYVYFPGKTELIKAVWKDVINHISSAQEMILCDSKKTFPEKLSLVISLIIGLFQRFDPLMIADLARESPRIWEWMNEERMAIVRNLTRLIRQGQSEEYVRQDIDAAFQTVYLESIATTMLTPERATSLDLGPEELFQTAMAIFLDGILNTTRNAGYGSRPEPGTRSPGAGEPISTGDHPATGTRNAHTGNTKKDTIR